MADIVINSKITVNKGGVSVANLGSTLNITMEGDQMYHHNPGITTTAAAISLGTVDVAADFWLYLRNADATNFVLVSTDGGATYKTKIRPGESWGPSLVVGGASVFLDADTATCIVEIVACEA